MNNKDTAVITIDMQEEFLKDFIGRQDVINFLIKQQVSVLEKAVEKNIPVVIVESVHPYGERDYGETDFIIMDSVRNYAPTGNYYKAIKKILCAFEDENLDGWLKRKNVGELFLQGINASACVKTTARDAIKIGYKISSAEDVIADCSGAIGDLGYDYFQWYRDNGV